MILNDQQIVNEFVRSSALRYATEKLLHKAKGALDMSSGFEDMAFVVSQVEKELTPEERALLLINANVAATNGNTDYIEFPQVVTVESLAESSNSSMIDAGNQFSEIWDNIVTMINSLSAVNQVTAKSIVCMQELNNQAQIDIDKSIKAPDSVMTLSNLPEELIVGEYDDNYLSTMSTYRDSARARISKATVTTISSIQELITSGMSEFSKSSIRTAEINLQNYKDKVSKALRLASENVEESADGLVTTVKVDTLPEQTSEIVVTDMAKLQPIIPINAQTLNQIADQLKSNLDLIDLSLESCVLLLDPKLTTLVTDFGLTVQNLLTSLPVNSRTKDIINDYCDYFIKSMNSTNVEIAYMLKVTQFIISYNELLADVIKHVSPSTQSEVI